MSTRTGIAPLFPESQSLVDRVGHAVRRAILEGRLRPGETLAISDLAADLGVSHSPVREALQRLSGQGLILLRPARTAVVAPLDLAELAEIYRLRELIEVDALGRAAQQLGDADIEQLEHHFQLLAAATATDSDLFWDAHTAFHRGLLAAARARDAAALRAAMTAHLRSKHDEVAGSLRQILPTPRHADSPPQAHTTTPDEERRR